MNEGNQHKNVKLLGLSSTKIKRKLSGALSHNSLFFLFLKILLIFLYVIIPIIAHNVINLERGAWYQSHGEIEKGTDYINATQAIGYSQPMMVFITVSLTVISLNIMNFLRRSLDKHNRRNQPKDIINSGIVYIVSTSLIISILFIVVMATYSGTILEEYDYVNQRSLQKYLIEYVTMMPIFIFFTGLSLYFECLIVECGINYWIMLSLGTIFLITDVSLAAILNVYTTLDPIISVITGTTISVIVKFFVYCTIFWKCIANWKPWQIKAKWAHIKQFWGGSWILCTYMLMYALMMLVQIMFMSIITHKAQNKYMIVDGHYLLVITRVGVYNILNIIISIPKSMTNALIVRYKDPEATPKQKLKTFEIARRISAITIWSMVIIGLIIWAFSDKIVNLLYGDFNWSHNLVPEGYPVNYFGENAKYIDIIMDFFKKGLFCGIIGQFAVNYSIYYRVIVYNFLQKDKRNFLFLMIIFGTCYGIFNYLFGVYYQSIFRGITGFMLTLFIYGVWASIAVRISAYRNKRKIYNQLLDGRYDDYIDQWWKIGPINYYKKIKYYKKIVMADCTVKYI